MLTAGIDFSRAFSNTTQYHRCAPVFRAKLYLLSSQGKRNGTEIKKGGGTRLSN